MSWKDILKQSSLQKQQDNKIETMKDLIKELNWLSDEINEDDGKLSELHNDLYQKIKPLLTNEKVNAWQGDLTQAEKLWDEAWNYKQEYSSSLENIAYFLEQVLDDLQEEEEEEEDGDGKIYANTPSGGHGEVHPSYRGYKLKDDEQWGESIMEDGKAYLVPKPIDNMYGAEW